MKVLYTGKWHVIKTTEQFESFDQIRAAAGDKTSTVLLALAQAGDTDLSAQFMMRCAVAEAGTCHTGGGGQRPAVE